jgi:sulfate adenylyltransferase subunit 1 (EFTu-like GTPase family)
MMDTLNTIEIASDRNFDDARFPVQYVNRPNLDFRGFCGTIASGIFHKGDRITALPSGKSSKIKAIVSYDGELEQAFTQMAVTLTLEDEIDISRGDMIVGNETISPTIADKFKAMIVWMADKAMTPGRQYLIKLATRSVSGSVSMIHHRVDVNTLEHHDATELNLNEIGFCTVSLNAPVVFDPYKKSKGTGSFIVIDRLSNVTVGAGMITNNADEINLRPVSPEDRAARFGQKATIILLKGHKAQETAYLLERKLFDNGHAATVVETLFEDPEQFAQTIKNAGLICLCVGLNFKAADIEIDTVSDSIDNIYASLKSEKIIF